MNEQREPTTFRSAIKPRDAIVSAVYKNGEPISSEDVFGDASQFTYDVLVHTDQSDTVYERVSPAMRRPSVEIRPAFIGSPVFVSYSGEDATFVIFEQPYYEEACDTPAAATAQGSLIGGLLRVLGLGGQP